MCIRDRPHPDFEHRLWRVEPLVLIVSPDHALAEAGCIERDRLVDLPMPVSYTHLARKAIGLAESDEPEKSALTAIEIKACQDAAKLDVTSDEIVEEWREDLKKNPIGGYQFSRQTPPLRDMDIYSLTPANSKRQEMVSLYADIDGFTAYVADHINEKTDDVVRTLHVIRSELERVVTSDFEAVSYTHLDVYKRQEQGGDARQ